MPPKRPIRNVFGDEDEDDGVRRNGDGTPPKKPKIAVNAASIVQPAQTSATTSSSTRPSNGAPLPDSIQAQVAAAKARIQAQMSALNNRGTLPRPPVPAAPTSSAIARPPAPNHTPATATLARPPQTSQPGSIQAQLEAARAKVQAKMAALTAKNAAASNGRATATVAGAASKPALSSSAAGPKSMASLSESSSAASSSKAPTGIHPLLLGESVPSSVVGAPKLMGANGRSSSQAPKVNPYLQASAEASEQAEQTELRPKPRSMHKGFQFHRPGRHVREAEEIRREQQMEELKRRIQESARKAGLEDDLTGDEKLIQRRMPPDVEWWDASLLANKTYDDVPVDQDVATMLEKGKAREMDASAYAVLLYGADSPIDHYIQHPIPIPAPTDKLQVQPKGIMLTKKEQRKMRRQRRAAELQDKRDRIKMGLLPPDPPKVKLSNLMRVLTSEAISDPTKVEARVRREIAARHDAHLRTNAERALTDQQRRAKVEEQKQRDEQKGLFCHVYRVKHLVSPSHKFKIRKNAADYNLSGATLFHPSFALVLVEGGAKALKAYKRLMTVRIDWTDPGHAKDQDDPNAHNAHAETTSSGYPDSNSNNLPLGTTADGGAGEGGGGFKHLTTSTSTDGEIDWSTNRCDLVFEGPVRERGFRGFRAISCPDDAAARQALGPAMQGYWDVAKRAASSLDDGV
ncbi:PRP3-domain-containing protein [Testicularia cyperi]|uniref:PRP3-domain-containing protein n=1 Tax=Testicularia cyperi TaxID=1882483 RepID=A0A317XGN2_9BASI|nr:PRP3-domain-containing protein [Testicularia cyperi]